MSTAKASVIVVNYNGAHLLPDCLTALARQRDDGVAFDAIVVDNASSDGSRELLARDFPWVRIIASPTNLGFAGGNNLALDEVTTPYAVLLNNDATPEPGWLRNLLAVFDEAGGHDIGIACGKILFRPKFARVQLRTPAFHPGPQDTRELGVRIYGVTVDGTEVTDKVLWEQVAFGPEGSGSGRFRWTRASGEFLLPLSPDIAPDSHCTAQPAKVTLSVAAEAAKPVMFTAGEQQVDARVDASTSDVDLELSPGIEVFDVINNAGSIVLQDGSGADRGFQEVDRGQYDEPGEVFAACGNGMAMRTVVGRELGWFDDAFFIYYEDTDLSWRWRARGWAIRYVPTAVLRHIHAASSKEWSPRWVFHVERNRLLMLTKNATFGLASRAVLGYLRGSGTRLARSLLDGVRTRRRPALREQLLRARVLRSYARQAPRALRERRRLRREAAVPASQLQGWLVSRR
ncbi:MAG TPA: glycosyltransferase family 2 protein [Jatrophihabitantaceae bacterium]|nr:glycosyltransferase family 2 protein [Jatrophihabitantaceae bacterium]